MRNLPDPRNVTDLTEARLERLLAEKATLLRRAADLDARASMIAAEWGFANRYCLRLSPEQALAVMKGGR